MDTETTGIDPSDSSIFEMALLIFDGANLKEEKLYHLNPLNDVIHFGEEAFAVNGVSEETIRSYPPPEEVIPEIVEVLKKYAAIEKLVFAGYKTDFDYGHLSALLARCGYHMGDFFSGRMIDVYQLVKKATYMGILPKTPNQKLETMTKALGIEHEDAHSALSDIKSTRRLYEAIYRLQRSKT